jgi:hypothetical protein
MPKSIKKPFIKNKFHNFSNKTSIIVQHNCAHGLSKVNLINRILGVNLLNFEIRQMFLS